MTKRFWLVFYIAKRLLRKLPRNHIGKREYYHHFVRLLLADHCLTQTFLASFNIQLAPCVERARNQLTGCLFTRQDHFLVRMYGDCCGLNER